MSVTGPLTIDEAAAAAPAIALRPVGTRLGRYELIAPLAEGGMGVVFTGRLVGVHGVERLVAIKTLRPVTSASDRAALVREAQVTARLHHRNVVATLDVGEVDAIPYVVMELIDGVSLANLVATLTARKLDLAPDLAAWIVMQAAQGLHAAHELVDGKGRPLHLVHRDVSPQNLLLSIDGEVKVADFGIAKFVGREESTATGMIKGKFGYMSPEQASATEIDRRSDVFSLGIVLWELLVRDRLFASDTPARTILRVTQEEAKSPTALRPAVDDAFSQIALRCLAKDAAARFQTAAELADALRSALRSKHTNVDGSELAALIETACGDEIHAAMRRRLAPAEPTDDATTLSLARSANVAVPLKPSRSSRFFGPVLLGALSVAAIGVVWPRDRANIAAPTLALPPASNSTEAVVATALPPPSIVQTPEPIPSAPKVRAVTPMTPNRPRPPPIKANASATPLPVPAGAFTSL